jgi:ankyrin repeat protein
MDNGSQWERDTSSVDYEFQKEKAEKEFYEWLQKLDFLLGKGADPRVSDKHKITPLHSLFDLYINFSFIEGGLGQIIDRLIKYGADVNAEDIHWGTPLHAAVTKGDLTSVKHLIDYGANVNAKTCDGVTALSLVKFLPKDVGQNIRKVLEDAGAVD